jgi:hypothetical protein
MPPTNRKNGCYTPTCLKYRKISGFMEIRETAIGRGLKTAPMLLRNDRSHTRTRVKTAKKINGISGQSVKTP